jgi:hypothetical protein
MKEWNAYAGLGSEIGGLHEWKSLHSSLISFLIIHNQIRASFWFTHPPSLYLYTQYNTCRLPRAKCVRLPIKMSSG